MLPSDFAFRRHMVHADIRGGSALSGPQKTVGWSELAGFNNLSRHLFGGFKVEASVITWRQEMPDQLFNDLKIHDFK